MRTLNRFIHSYVRHLMLSAATLVLLAASVPAVEYYVNIPDKVMKRTGCNKRQGPFATREAAEAYVHGGAGFFIPEGSIVEEKTNDAGDDGRRGDGGAAAATAAATQAEQEEAERQCLLEERRLKEVADKKVATEKQAAFDAARDAAVKTLKGSPGSADHGDLKGSTDHPGLKGVVADHGLKGSTPHETGAKQVQAWKQLHCASVIAGAALDALQTKGDYDQFGALSIEALKALDGQRLNVQCGDPPPFPDLGGIAVDMEQVKVTERAVIQRATAIAGRMKERRGTNPTPPLAPTGPETAEEKMRRVQKELNAVNSQKIDGTTQAQIDQQRKDQEVLAKLIMINNGFAKGKVAVVINLDDLADSPPPPPPPPPKPTP